MHRQYKQDAQELKELQAQRKKDHEEVEERTRPQQSSFAQTTGSNITLAASAVNGFEFTNKAERGKENAAGTNHQSSDVVLSGTTSV